MKSFALTIDNIVENTDLVDKLYHLVNDIGHGLSTNSFIAKEELYGPLNYSNEFDYVVKEITRTIWLNKLSCLLKDRLDEVVGFET